MSKITEALKKAEMERLKKKENKTPQEKMFSKIEKRVEIKPKEEIVLYYEPDSNIAEQYRMAKMNLQRFDPKNPPCSIAITSSIHNEGKSVTAVNLAFTLANDSNKTVLLVDADLRKPTLVNLIGLNHGQYRGLSNMLEEFIPLDSLLLNLSKNLHFLPSGKKNSVSSNLLSQPHAKEAFAFMKKKFDWVIIDSPPILSLADAGVLGSYADGCLLVIRAGSTQRKTIENAIDIMKQNRIRIIGAFLTGFQSRIPSYLSKYYYSHNYYQSYKYK
jgi:capsular exopolysaccharide synthesis family protein